MDQHNIISINDQASRQKSKDKRVLHQERAILLTAQDSIVKYHNYQLDRIMAPAVAAERLEMRDRVCAEKRMAAEAKKKAIEDRKAARDAEKRRFESLSADEQKAERAEKRRRNKESRDATAQIIEEYDRENINPNQIIIQDFNSSDITLELFEDDSNIF